MLNFPVFCKSTITAKLHNAPAMLKLAHDEELRARMSANAIAKSDDFSIDKAVKEWDGLFERVVAKKRGK